MHLSAKQNSERLVAAVGEVLHLVAQPAPPEQTLSRVIEVVTVSTGAVAGIGMLFQAPVMPAIAGFSVCPDVDALQQAASSLAPGSVSASEVFITPGVDHIRSAVLAPVHIGDRLCGALHLLFDTQSVPDEATLAFVQAAASGISVVANNLELTLSAARSEQLSASLVAAINDPLMILDANRSIVTLNPAARQVFDVAHADVAGQPIDVVISSEELLQIVGSATSGHHAEWSAKDGRAFVPHIEAVRGSDGSVEGWVVILNDVTRFKRLIRNQSEFTRIVSHDLRSPMTSMQGFASMLEMVGDLNDRQKHFVEKILSGISQMTALVDNIQDAGRYDPETGFYDMSRTQCDICELVTRITNNHLVPAEKQDLTLTVEVAPDVPVISADAHMLERAVTNLIDNAIKYTPNGGKVSVGVYLRDNQVIISVRDNGLGISPDNQKLLFERHFRIARQEHRRVKGSGLGLFIVRSVAQRHGGRAWVESADGQGSTFLMSIPLEGDNLVGGAA